MSQQIKLRSYIVAPPGKVLVSCDLSQAETWIVAFASNDIEMQDALLNSDIHRKTAAAIYDKPFDEVVSDERYTGKRINHASAYRMSPERFTQVYNKDAASNGVKAISVKQAREYMKRWHGLYFNIKSWWSTLEAELNSSRELSNYYGRRRYFFGHWGDELFKEATAFKPQSTVADHFNGLVHPELGISGGLLGIYRKFRAYKDVRIVQQGHDSLVFEAPHSSALELAHEAMNLLRRPLVVENREFTIPVDGEIGTDWGNLEKIRA
jgi:DNA polymerase I